MIFDSRTDSVKLHHKDKVYLSGALGVLKALGRCEPDTMRHDEVMQLYMDLNEVCRRHYGIFGDEHLKRPQKADVKPELDFDLETA